MKTYIISSYIPNTNYDKDFLLSLEVYCKKNKAKLIILPSKEKLKKDQDTPFEREIQEELKPYLRFSEIRLNKNLLVSNFKIDQSSIDPLLGMEMFASKHNNIILPYPRHRMKTVPRMIKDSHLPRAMWCSGSISENDNYKDNKSGTNLRDYHKKGALIVKVENNNIFHVRQISWNGKGFYDLKTLYTPRGSTQVNPVGLSLGDTHVGHTNVLALKETKRQINHLELEQICEHDTLDWGNNTSHHQRGKHITQTKNLMTVKQELSLVADHLLSWKKDCPKLKRVYQIASNHNEHMDSWLENQDFDPVNARMGHLLSIAKIDGLNVFRYAMSLFHKLPHVKFLDRDSNLIWAGNRMDIHGDFGANGSRGNTKEKGITNSGMIITGHTHSPEIGPLGNYVNGTLTDLMLPYTNPAGSSSWLHANTLVYPDGNKTHLYIINGSSGLPK